eukprot:scaffold223622_cov31-Attheya_sp.AAC.1
MAMLSGVKSTGGHALRICFIHPPKCKLSAAPCAAAVMLAPACSARSLFSSGVQHFVARTSLRRAFASPDLNRLMRSWTLEEIELLCPASNGARIMAGSKNAMMMKGLAVSLHSNVSLLSFVDRDDAQASCMTAADRS